MRKNMKYLYMLTLLIVICSCSEDTIEDLGIGKVTGTVIEDNTGNPISDAKVTVVSSNVSLLTDANGNFVMDNVTIGQQSISVEKDSYLTSFESVNVISGGTVNIIVEMPISTTNNNPPNQPVLESPDDNALDLGLEVTLTWHGEDIDEDDLTYKVELRNDENADVEIFDQITEEELVLTNLNYGTKYFWQVSATDNVSPEVWSMTRTFLTTSNPIHRFLFTRKINSNQVIFSGTPNANASQEDEVLKLTVDSDNCWRPRRNITNGLIAFLKNEGSEVHLFSMNIDGSDVQQITNAVPVNGFDLNHFDFCWSNNGAKLLYTNFDKLYSINKDGSGLTLVYQTTDGSFISECDWTVDESMIALKVNNVNGYGVSIFTINMSGIVLNNVLSAVSGAAGGLNFSVDNTKLLYTHDISGFESADYRQLDTHIFLYDLVTDIPTDLSVNKPVGFLDLDPRFSPNESEIVYTYISNDGVSESQIYTIDASSGTSRTELFTNANMPDWE